MLSASQIARMDVVVEKARLAYVQASDLVPAWYNPMNWIAPDTTVSAMHTDVAATLNLYNVLRDKRDRLAHDPYATEEDVLEMEGAVPALSNTALEQAAEQLSFDAFTEQVVVQTFKDTADVITNPLGIPIWVWGLAAVAVLVVIKKS